MVSKEQFAYCSGVHRFLRNHDAGKKGSYVKVLHCPEIVGGNAQQLARSERELGLESRSIAFRQNSFLYETDEVLLPPKAGKIRFAFARWRLLWRALAYDVIHFNFGQTIMPSCAPPKQGRFWLLGLLESAYSCLTDSLDLWILRRLRKGIVVTYQGDDARQGDYCRKNFAITFATEVGPEYYNSKSDDSKRKRIAKFAKYADRIYALNPDLLHVLPKQGTFLPYSLVDLHEWCPVDTYNKRPVVIHAPSHREVKGTRFLLKAVDLLREEKIDFEFVLVEGLSRDKARKQYERADLLVDQLLAGWYGGLAVELMALGKPVMAYLRKEDLGFIPNEMRNDLPIINATPDTIYEVLRYWLTDGRSQLRKIGLTSRNFVEKWHDPLKIANILKAEYEVILEGKRSKSTKMGHI